jgi:DNA polymerase-4
MKAARLAPEAILLPADFEVYRDYSRRFKSAVRAIAPQIEDRGIDEIYIDLTDVAGTGETPMQARADDPWDRARSVAQSIKAAVRAATGLSCSIGITPNKLLSKIASELDKPDGLTILTAPDLATRVWPLPARKINGIGPKTSTRLETLGIRTIGELALADRAWLVEHFGNSLGVWMHDAAHGRDERPVVTVSEPKSISRETTFERDLDARRDRDALSRIFTELCADLAEDLRRSGYAGKTIGLKLRFSDFRTVTRDQTIALPTQDALMIRRIAGECLRRVTFDRRIRLLGVRIGTLGPVESFGAAPMEVAEPTPSLFDPIE